MFPTSPWLRADELPMGLGCMRLSTAQGASEEHAFAVLAAALAGGFSVFDTAHAYSPLGQAPGHNERILGEAIRRAAAQLRVRVVTKGGMHREGAAWIPDGRAGAIERDCAASLEALGGVAIDTYLLHAPDPRTPWATSVRALAALLERGWVRRIGICNVNRRLLDEALTLAPIGAVQVALGASDDEAIRGGVVARCVELGIPVMAHSPLGGPDRARAVAKDRALQVVAERLGATPAEVLLAGVRQLGPGIVPIPGATRPETVASVLRAARLTLTEAEVGQLQTRKPFSVAVKTATLEQNLREGEVVLIAGLQGAGKTGSVEGWVARGYERLNRDERGGTLQKLAKALDRALTEGATRVVLDNTYATRASRRTVVEVARKHRLPVRIVWMDVPLAQAQVNVVLRMLETHGRLLEPEEMNQRDDPSSLPPHGQYRTARELEPPGDDEGFSSIQVESFTRRSPLFAGRGPVRCLSLDAVIDEAGAPRPAAAALLDAPRVALYAWRPEAPDPLQAVVARLPIPPTAQVVHAECRHPAGPPRCWCRPPLPGLLLALAHANGWSLEHGELVGSGATHRNLATSLKLAHRDPG